MTSFKSSMKNIVKNNQKTDSLEKLYLSESHPEQKYFLPECLFSCLFTINIPRVNSASCHPCRWSGLVPCRHTTGRTHRIIGVPPPFESKL